MACSYQEQLALLRELFPRRMVLSSEDVAVALGRSTIAIQRLRSRGLLPLRWSPIGRRVVVNITDLARYLVLLCNQQEHEPATRYAIPGEDTPSKRGPKKKRSAPKADGPNAPRQEIQRPSIFGVAASIRRSLIATTTPLGDEFWMQVFRAVVRQLNERLPSGAAMLALRGIDDDQFVALASKLDTAGWEALDAASHHGVTVAEMTAWMRARQLTAAPRT